MRLSRLSETVAGTIRDSFTFNDWSIKPAFARSYGAPMPDRDKFTVIHTSLTRAILGARRMDSRP